MNRDLLRGLNARVLTTFLLALFAVALAPCSSAAPDLTATAEEYVSSGIIYKRLVFQGEKQRGEMELPNGWSHRNLDPTRLQLIPGTHRFAEAVIRIEPLPKAHALGQVAIPALQQQALAEVPAASQDVSHVRSTENPGGPGGGESLEVVVAYKALGYTFHRSSLFVNWRDSRLVIQLTAPEADFDALSATLQRALQSWHWQEIEVPTSVGE